MAQTVARLLTESLEAHDIDLVYCVPGESYLGLTNLPRRQQPHSPRRLPP